MDKSLLNRKMYKAIKKYDRQEMEDFFRAVFEDGFHKGFKEGADAAPQIDFKIELAQLLEDVKGIGPKTKEKIINAYNSGK